MVKFLFRKFFCLMFIVVIIINITDNFLTEKNKSVANGNVIEANENTIEKTRSVTNETFTAKAAIVKNVLDDGSNLMDDLHTGSNTLIQDISLDIIPKPDNALQIISSIGSFDISITGIPVAVSDNGHIIFYKANSNNPGFKVVDMEYSDNASTNMFFKDYKEKNNGQKILKLYLKDLSGVGRNYIIIECFNYEARDFNSMVSVLPQDNTMGAWAAEEFMPVSAGFTDMAACNGTCNKKYTYTVEYNELAFPQVHTITLEAGCTYGDIPRGQMKDIIYSIRITGKTMECPGNPGLNSETESFLHVNSLSLRQVTVPNAAFVSTSVDGKVLKKGGNRYLSAANGINKDVLGASLLAIPVEFSNNGMDLDYNSMDLNSAYEGFENGRGGMYVRSIKTIMQKQDKLTQTGDYFAVHSTIADFGNVAKDKDYHRAVWDIDIINADNLSVQNKTIYQDVPVAIK